MKKHVKRILSVALSASMVLGTMATAASAKTLAPALDADEFAAPSMQYRPGVRWWLPGGAIEADEMAREVNYLADNGFGFAEIQPFGGALVKTYGDTTPYDNYETEAYYAAIESAVATAAKRGLTIDMNLGSGWNANSKDVSIEHSLGNMAIGRKIVTISQEQVGSTICSDVPALELSPAYNTDKLSTEGSTAKALGVMVAKIAGVREGAIKKGVLNTDSATDDQLLMDADTVIMVDLTGSQDETINWTPDAAGEYALVTLYSYPTGCRPIDSVNTTDGFVVDHMDGDAVTAYMESWMGEGSEVHEIMSKYPGTIRAFFNDSYEFYGDTYFTRDMYDLARDAENNGLGYDYSPYLVMNYQTSAMWPFYMIMFGMVNASGDTFVTLGTEDGTAKNADATSRITYDYNVLVNEMFEEGLEAFQTVANKYDGLYRAQAYNTPTDTIGSAKYVDIPESEQQNEDALKRTASGSHLYNRELTTAEQFTLGNTPFQNDLDKIKDGIDLMATAGVNNFFYHGFNYSYFGDEATQAAHGYGETGYSGFFSIGVNMTENNALHTYFSDINAYAARANYLGQLGSISSDVALYMELNGSIKNTSGAGKVLNANGYTWDAINDEAIQEMASYDAKTGLVCIAGSDVTYQAIVVQNASLPVATMEALQKLAAEGANVVFYNNVPSAQPGYAAGNYAAEDARVAAIAADMMAAGTVHAETEEALVAALGQTGEISYTTNNSLRMIRRTLEDGSEMAYIRNTASTANEVTILVPDTYETVYWLDQNTGKIYNAVVTDGKITVSLNDTAAVALLACPAGVEFAAQDLSVGTHQAIDEIYLGTAEAKQTLALNEFELTVTADNIGTNGAYGEERTVHYTEDVLGNWGSDAYHNGELKFVNAEGVYTTTLMLDETYDSAFYLNLGEVNTAATVTVNGEEVGSVLYAPYKLDISDALVEGENTIEIVVTPKTWNRYAGFSTAYQAAAAANDQEAMNLYQFYKSVRATTVGAGLVGPVSVEVYDDADVYVTAELTGKTEATVDQKTLNYELSLSDAEQAVTATVTMEVTGTVTDVTAEALNGWYIIDQTYAEGVLTVVTGNNAGMTGEGTILAVTASTTGKTGTVTAKLLDVILSAYAGAASEVFVDVKLGQDEVTTVVDYSTYDVNCDGTVNQLDITRAQRAYGAAEGDDNWNARADVDGNGIVEITDFILILNNYSK